VRLVEPIYNYNGFHDPAIKKQRRKKSAWPPDSKERGEGIFILAEIRGKFNL
jgi:hypothetical protein